MAGRGDQFSGLTVALITPFSDGAVDEAALRRQVDWQIEAGTNCLSPCGTTGESPTLSHEEHERVIGIVCEQTAGRAKVMAGTGSNNTAEAIRLTKFARSAGADGALMVAPYYNKPSRKASSSITARSLRRSTFRSWCTTFPAARRRTSSRKR